MQRATLTASTLGLALSMTLQDSTADHGSLAAVSDLSPPPSASPNTAPEDIDDGLAQLGHDMALLAQGDLDSEDEAMLAEMLAEYGDDMEPTELAEKRVPKKGNGWDYDSKANKGWFSSFPRRTEWVAKKACQEKYGPMFGTVYAYDAGSFWSWFRCCTYGMHCRK